MRLCIFRYSVTSSIASTIECSKLDNDVKQTEAKRTAIRDKHIYGDVLTG